MPTPWHWNDREPMHGDARCVQPKWRAVSPVASDLSRYFLRPGGLSHGERDQCRVDDHAEYHPGVPERDEQCEGQRGGDDARIGHAMESPGTPHTARASTAKPAMVAAMSARATRGRALSGTSHDSSIENSGTSCARYSRWTRPWANSSTPATTRTRTIIGHLVGGFRCVGLPAVCRPRRVFHQTETGCILRSAVLAPGIGLQVYPEPPGVQPEHRPDGGSPRDLEAIGAALSGGAVSGVGV